MIIIRDTREQHPLQFSDKVQVEVAQLAVDDLPKKFQVNRETLNYGDYTIKGLERTVVIERKGEGDLYGSCGKGRDRFLRKLEAFRTFRYAALVIETTWPRILSGAFPYGTMAPNQIMGSLMSFSMKWCVIPVLAGDHRTAGILTENLLHQFARNVDRDYKAMHKADPPPKAKGKTKAA